MNLAERMKAQAQMEYASQGAICGSQSVRDYAANDAPKSTPGITTAVQDLAQEVGALSQLAFSLRAALGITEPEDGCKNAGEQSLLNQLQSLTYRLRSANGDLSDVLRHLTS